jgi:glutathione S-transferase
MEFLEDAYPEAKPSLYPTDPYDRAVVRIWVDHITKNYVPASHRLLQAQEPEKQEQARNDLIEAQRKLAQQIKGPYFSGEQFGIVDIAVAPWIAREWVIAENRGYDRNQAGEAWAKYAKAVAERPSLLKTESVSFCYRFNALQLIENFEKNKEHYIPIYGRYLRDEAQSEAAKALRAGRVIP